MREIKFKAWDNELKYMIDLTDMIVMTFDDGSMGICDFEGLPLDSTRTLEEAQKEKLNPRYTFIQYIGLQDKKGKEIYEFDIFSYKCKKCELIHIGSVIWMPGQACFGYWNGKVHQPLITPLFEENGECHSMGTIDIQEVLGNIYESPDLVAKHL